MLFRSGFRKTRSTITALIPDVEWIVKNLDNNKCVSSLMLDFTAAFDTMDISSVATRLLQLGVVGDMGTMIIKWLMDRTQVVQVGESFSREETLTSGCAQGSCLGPICFIIFISGITEAFKRTKSTYYADDSKAMAITTDPVGMLVLDEEATAAHTWATENSMSFSKGKSALLQFGKHKYNREVYLGDEKIDKVSEAADLGVIIDTGLTFRQHLQKIKIGRAHV